jgi:hypothetical protein
MGSDGRRTTGFRPLRQGRLRNNLHPDGMKSPVNTLFTGSLGRLKIPGKINLGIAAKTDRNQYLQTSSPYMGSAYCDSQTAEGQKDDRDTGQ